MLLAYSRLFLIIVPHLSEAYYQNRYVPAPQIAELYKLNVRALMPALHALTCAGILRSHVGGKEPGFIFSRDPQQVTMLELITALQGESCFVCCNEIKSGVHCGSVSRCECFMYQLFNDIILQAKIRLSKISLAEYCSESIGKEVSVRAIGGISALQQYGYNE